MGLYSRRESEPENAIGISIALLISVILIQEKRVQREVVHVPHRNDLNRGYSPKESYSDLPQKDSSNVSSVDHRYSFISRYQYEEAMSFQPVVLSTDEDLSYSHIVVHRLLTDAIPDPRPWEEIVPVLKGNLRPASSKPAEKPDHDHIRR
ncbi:hypothetical protein TNCV_1098091 [Trichonephila clavipes]|nr:hypothetical protein TNCV_1098091 [Trichonephila clavipes]